MAFEASEPADLHVLEIREPALRGRIALAWRAAGPAGPAARALLDHLRATLAG
ncbi:hypothetical protein [Amycolatopsis sp. NPDC058986]|uniref:hypothetical protein n=1 Tax=unclassified Amycolatopsis TaxID=2618356 RepID=UPI00366E50EB